MNIDKNSYKLSYKESVIALTGTAMLRQHEAHDTDEDILRVVQLISNSIATSRMYISTRLEYQHNQSPSEQMIDDQCQDMDTFISLPKDETTNRVLPIAVEAYVWHGNAVSGLVTRDKLNIATGMIMSLMVDIESSEDTN